jgi:hypothetical protein
LSENPQEPRPWYERLGFLKYHIDASNASKTVSECSGYITSGHYYHYVLTDGSNNLDISGQTHPISYTHQNLIQGSWTTRNAIQPYAVKDFILFYEDPITWTRVRIPNMYFRAADLILNHELRVKNLDFRLRIEKPDMRSSVYSTFFAQSFSNNVETIKNLSTDIIVYNANTYYIQSFTDFIFNNIKDILNSNKYTTWSLNQDEFITSLDLLYPQYTLCHATGFLEHDFDIEFHQDTRSGIELTALGDPQDLLRLTRLFPWLQWDPSVIQGLQQYSLVPGRTISVVWDPGQSESLEFFAISLDKTKPALDSTLQDKGASSPEKKISSEL